jgi:hypothetical protein
VVVQDVTEEAPEGEEPTEAESVILDAEEAETVGADGRPVNEEGESLNQDGSVSKRQPKENADAEAGADASATEGSEA